MAKDPVMPKTTQSQNQLSLFPNASCVWWEAAQRDEQEREMIFTAPNYHFFVGPLKLDFWNKKGEWMPMNCDEHFLPDLRRWERTTAIFCKPTISSASGPAAALINC